MTELPIVRSPESAIEGRWARWMSGLTDPDILSFEHRYDDLVA
jgi:hypothetical protein